MLANNMPIISSVGFKEHYEAATDWEGQLYCGPALYWDYNAYPIDISKPGYVAAAFHQFQHKTPTLPCPIPMEPAKLWCQSATHGPHQQHQQNDTRTNKSVPTSGWKFSILYLSHQCYHAPCTQLAICCQNKTTTVHSCHTSAFTILLRHSLRC